MKQSYYVAQASLKPADTLSSPSPSLGYRCVSQHPVCLIGFVFNNRKYSRAKFSYKCIWSGNLVIQRSIVSLFPLLST